MLNLSFLFVNILLEGWPFASRQTKSCEARYEQDNKSRLSYSLRAGQGLSILIILDRP